MPTFVALIGTLDGEVRTAQVGTPPKTVANFRLDCHPGWYNVAAWSDLSTKAPAPGVTVLVTGRLSGRSYESDKYHDAEGKPAKINVVEVVASTIEPMTAAPADDLFAD